MIKNKLRRMDNVGIVVESLDEAISCMSSKESGPVVQIC